MPLMKYSLWCFSCVWKSENVILITVIGWLQGRNIRYVQIPDDVNIMKTINEQVKIITPAAPDARKPKLSAEERKMNAKQEKKKKLASAVEAMKAQLADSSKSWTAVLFLDF